ncbi:MAG: hypothetical protein J0H44_30475 [Alphaproteobacteria bacterium]|nr:hypothetical protein [Alphaproteobacteria bacterium]
MSTRTTETTVTFGRSFVLTAIDGVQPAGTYRLVTEEEQIPGLSFAAYQRRSTMLHLPANPAPGQARYVVQVDPAELATALAADAIRVPRLQ